MSIQVFIVHHHHPEVPSCSLPLIVHYYGIQKIESDQRVAPIGKEAINANAFLLGPIRLCLANVDQKTVPDSQERADLLLAGLGEKKIALDEFSHSQEIYSELIFQFPKLSEAGGFELLRISEGSGKVLQETASPKNGYTVPYLRAVVHSAVVYIRPMQKDLSLVHVDTAVSNIFCPLGCYIDVLT
jgi:hypothetical protein